MLPWFLYTHRQHIERYWIAFRKVFFTQHSLHAAVRTLAEGKLKLKLKKLEVEGKLKLKVS